LVVRRLTGHDGSYRSLFEGQIIFAIVRFIIAAAVGPGAWSVSLSFR
jgi:hypothetical protein